MKEKEILQADTLEQQHQLPENYNKLSSHHFPLFLTVQRLVYMVDASLQLSFFTRSHDGKIIGMESSLGWQSEDQGVFMINQDFKQREEIKKDLQEFELKILSGQSETEIEGFVDGGNLDLLQTDTDASKMDLEALKTHSDGSVSTGLRYFGKFDEDYRKEQLR